MKEDNSCGFGKLLILWTNEN